VYGKLKETHQIEHSRFADMTDEDVEERFKELQEKLGLQLADPVILPSSSDDSKVQ